MATDSYLDVELHVMSSRRARLLCSNRPTYADTIELSEERCHVILELEHAKDFDGYGQALFAAAFPAGSDLQRGLYSVLDSARHDAKQLRLRLNIEGGTPARLHALHWELLADGKDFAAGRSPSTVFSRYVSPSQPQPLAQAPVKPRMLCVIASPIDIHRHKMAPIDYDYARRRLEDECFTRLRAGLEIDYLERPVTPEKLREALKSRRYDLLHLHGHGTLPRRGESALVLEGDDFKVSFMKESALCEVLRGLTHLRLVTLVACHGGQPSTADEHLSGLAGSLVRLGVPAVIAMRRAINMRLGFDFTRHFYPQLVDSPCVDAAVNEARHRLFMADPVGAGWSSPVLYMRLEDGLLWTEEAEQTESIGAEPRPLARAVHKNGSQPGQVAFKRRNLLSLGVVLVLNALLFALVHHTDSLNWSQAVELWRRVEPGDYVVLTLAPILALIVNGWLSEPVKATLVFWRLQYALPGCRAFTEHAPNDLRIDMARLRSRHGELRLSPPEQNRLWYRILKRVEGNPGVREAHRVYLLTRDVTAFASVFLIFYPLVILLGLSDLSPSRSYAAFLVFQYLATSVAARHYGNRLVGDVLAVESSMISSGGEVS